MSVGCMAGGNLVGGSTFRNADSIMAFTAQEILAWFKLEITIY